jgi:hypothetical protein
MGNVQVMVEPRNTYKIVRKFSREEFTSRHGCRSENFSERNEWEGGDRIYLAQDSIQ